MHKLTDATIEIIEVMASNAYNGVGNRRILKRPTGVHQVVTDPSSSSVEQKMDMLAE